MSLVPRGQVVLSECGLYRTWLTRELGGERPLVSIGANPSIADAETDDQTMRKEQAFARLWGCGRLIKVNMYAYRATKPSDMWKAEKAGVDIVGCDVRGLHNDAFIQKAINDAFHHKGIVLACWGAIPKLPRVNEFLRKLDTYPFRDEVPLMCLGTNDNGSPKHTLYLPYETPLVPWGNA